MARGLFIAATVFVALVLVCPGAFANDLAKLHWLAGTWVRESERGPVYEEWTILTDDTIEGSSWALSPEGERVPTESLLLASMHGDVFYMAKVGPNPYPVPFKLTSIAGDRATFENPEHDFPTRILYERDAAGTLTVTVDDPAGGAESPRLVFHFTRDQGMRRGASDRAASGDTSVRWFGALRAMMHEGQTSTVVRTSDVVPGPHTYAVGALSELRGEVTIVNDQVWLSYPHGAGHRTIADANHTEGAALLVTAQVEHWDEVRIEEDLALDEFEAHLAKLAEERQLADEPFVFRVEALFPRLEIHVVDGSKLKPGTSAREHHAASVQIKSMQVAATLVGFRSSSHQGVFTHHGETTHVHAVLSDPLVTGHVDAVVVPQGAILKLPRAVR